DLDTVARAAGDHGVMLEVNAQPERLDLDDLAARAAVERGARLVIGSDAHATAELGFLRWGVDQARRGWVAEPDVANALPHARDRRVSRAGRRRRGGTQIETARFREEAGRQACRLPGVGGLPPTVLLPVAANRFDGRALGAPASNRWRPITPRALPAWTLRIHPVADPPQGTSPRRRDVDGAPRRRSISATGFPAAGSRYPLPDEPGLRMP